MIPLGWHIQRSGIPGGRRGSKGLTNLCSPLVFLNHLNCKSKARAASILTRHSDSTQAQDVARHFSRLSTWHDDVLAFSMSGFPYRAFGTLMRVIQRVH